MPRQHRKNTGRIVIGRGSVMTVCGRLPLLRDLRLTSSALFMVRTFLIGPGHIYLTVSHQNGLGNWGSIIVNKLGEMRLGTYLTWLFTTVEREVPP